MNQTLSKQRNEIAEAMQGLCDAVGKLGRIRDEMADNLQTLPHGHPDERITVQLNRACNHLTHASADVPDEFWAIMLNRENVATINIENAMDTSVFDARRRMCLLEMAGV